MNNETQESVKHPFNHRPLHNEHNQSPLKTPSHVMSGTTPANQIEALTPPNEVVQIQNGQANGPNQLPKDKNRDLSTAKTAQSTPVNPNPNASRTIGHYVVGKSPLSFAFNPV